MFAIDSDDTSYIADDTSYIASKVGPALYLPPSALDEVEKFVIFMT